MEVPSLSYYPPNNHGLFNNRQFIEALYNKITLELKRPLSNSEKRWLQNFLHQEIPTKFRNKTNDVFLTSFKGLRQDGKYRRRLDFNLAISNSLNLIVSLNDFICENNILFSFCKKPLSTCSTLLENFNFICWNNFFNFFITIFSHF